MQKSRKKKGFTLTELAIVIAVIAILIAVLVPTFTSLINKARESADSQLAKNMNTLLATAEAEGNEPERMEDVNEILVEGGYTIAKLTPSADGNIFVWNEETNRISYISEDGTVLYAGDSTLTTDGTFTATGNYWVTVESENEIKTWENLSYYLGCDIELSDVLTISSASSIDTGTYTLTGTVKYSGSVSSADVSYKTASTTIKKAAKTSRNYNNSVVIWGEIDGQVTLETTGLTVENNSTAKIDLTSANVTEYTEYGYAKTLDISGNTSTKITITNNGMVEELIIGNSVTSYTNVTNNGYIGDIVESESGTSKASSVTLNVKGYVEKTAETDGSSYTYEISNYSQLASFRDKVNNGKTFAGITVKLTADIDISGRSWVPIGYDSRDTAKNYHSGKSTELYKYFGGTFDGNNKTISGLTNTGFIPTTTRIDTYGTKTDVNNYLFGLFGIINGATIKNLTMTDVNIVEEDIVTDSVGAIAGFASGACTITGCTVYGSIEGTDAAGGIIGRIYTYDGAWGKYVSSTDKYYFATNSKYTTSTDDYTLKTLTWNSTDTSKNVIVISDCNNYATITADDDGENKAKAGGIVGFYCDYSGIGMKIENCNNYGNVTATLAASGIITSTTGGLYCTTDDNNPYSISSCYNKGSISVVSSATYTFAGTISMCYTNTTTDGRGIGFTISSSSSDGNASAAYTYDYSNGTYTDTTSS